LAFAARPMQVAVCVSSDAFDQVMKWDE